MYSLDIILQTALTTFIQKATQELAANPQPIVRVEQGRRMSQAMQYELQHKNKIGVFSPLELQRILNQKDKLLIFIAKPHLVTELFPDLAISLDNKLHEFVEKYFSEGEIDGAIQFYFNRTANKVQLAQLQAELTIPNISISAEISHKELFFRICFESKEGKIAQTFAGWQWQSAWSALSVEYATQQAVANIIEELIIQAHKILISFLTDWYYLRVNPYYIPRLFSPAIVMEKLPDSLFSYCFNALFSIKNNGLSANIEMPAVVVPSVEVKNFSEKKDKKRKFSTNLIQVISEQEKGVAVTFETFKAGKKASFTAYEKVLEINCTSLIMVYIPAGEFYMGSSDYEDEKPIHLVSFKNGFYMSKFPVTQQQYEQVMGSNPSHFTDSNYLPVECISWIEARKFCEKLSLQLEKLFRLPTEAEWEYVARAGTNTKYWWGDNMDGKYCWCSQNSNGKTHAVDEKMAEHINPFGICDMAGNVWEWTYSDYVNGYDGSEIHCSENIKKNKVLRGGAWNGIATSCRSANRNFDSPEVKYYFNGIRLVAENL